MQSHVLAHHLVEIQLRLLFEQGDQDQAPPGRFQREPPPRPAPAEPPPGHKRDETEGVFLLPGTRAVFTPVKIGIAGEQYFEVIEGLKTGDRVITGPFANVRELTDGQEIRLQQESRNRRSGNTTRDSE